MKISTVTAIVTGGASGLGEATVRRLHAGGANVVILDFADKGQEVADELGPKALFAKADITNSDSIQAAVDKAVAKFGKVNVLVNCAGAGGPAAKIASKNGPFDIEAFKKVLNINLIGTFDVTRLTAQSMIGNEPNEELERGVIVNTSSLAAFEGQIGQVAYATSKAGIVGMTLVIARDLSRDGVRCVTIAPGAFETPLLGNVSDEVRAALGKPIPFPSRLGRPSEFAQLVQSIIENPMLNGETIRLDGAMRMQPK